MAPKSWGLRKIGIVGIPSQARARRCSAAAPASNIPSHPPPFWASLITHHSPRSHSLMTHRDLNRSWGGCSFTTRSFWLWLLPQVWRRILHAWAALGCVSNQLSIDMSLVPCHKKRYRELKYLVGGRRIGLTLRCWGNSSIPEGRFSKWF